MGKKIKKAIQKVTKAADVLGVHDEGKSKESAPAAAVVTAPAPAAATVANPEATTDTAEADTEAAKKSARSKGKTGLSVARSPGSGLNV
jgi:hypothetical protein